MRKEVVVDSWFVIEKLSNVELTQIQIQPPKSNFQPHQKVLSEHC